MASWSRILLATDFSRCSDEATEVAIELALRLNASLTLVHVFEIPAYVYADAGFSTVDLFTPLERAAETTLREVLTRVQKRVPGAQSVLRSGSPTAEILAVSEQLPADVVILGTHGRRGAAHLLLGSVAEKVVRQARMPVLTIRGVKE